MAEQKTKPTAASVDDFLQAIPDDARRADAIALFKLMKAATRKKPRMWGGSIVGFGEYHYVYASGHEGDAPLIGFSPRKAALVLYICAGLQDRSAAALKKLGKVKTGKGCLYIKKLADVDLAVLRAMIKATMSAPPMSACGRTER